MTAPISERARTHLIASLREIASHALIGDHTNQDGFHWVGPENPFSLLGEPLENFRRIREELLKNPIIESRSSERAVDRGLTTVLEKTVKDGDGSNTVAYFDEFLTGLQKSWRQQRVLVPLAGLVMMSQEPLELGRVILRRLSDKEADEIGSQFRVEHWREVSRKSITAGVCADFEAMADKERALELAETETRRSLDLIRYAIPVTYRRDHRVHVGLLGEVFRVNRTSLILSEDDPGLSTSVEGALMPFRMSDATIQAMDTIGVFDMSNVLKKPVAEVTNYEEAILRAIHWLADAINEPEPDNALVSLMTSLETFLNPQGAPYAENIATGAAICVFDDLEKRRVVRRRVKKLYRARSGVSHGGKTVVTEDDVEFLTDVAHRLIRTMICRRNEFSTCRDLADWLVDQKLG